MVRVCRSRWPLICIEIHGAYLSFVRCFPPVPVCWLLKGPDKSFKCSPLFHQNVGIFACGGLAAGAPTTWQSYCQLHCLSSRSPRPHLLVSVGSFYQRVMVTPGGKGGGGVQWFTVQGSTSCWSSKCHPLTPGGYTVIVHFSVKRLIPLMVITVVRCHSVISKWW